VAAVRAELVVQVAHVSLDRVHRHLCLSGLCRDEAIHLKEKLQ
jgi:hypothetical protein